MLTQQYYTINITQKEMYYKYKTAPLIYFTYTIYIMVAIDQFRYIKIQPNTVDLRTRLWGINPTNSVFIPQSLVLRSIVLGWILIYRNWPIIIMFYYAIKLTATNKTTAGLRLQYTFRSAIFFKFGFLGQSSGWGIISSSEKKVWKRVNIGGEMAFYVYAGSKSLPLDWQPYGA